MQPADHNASGTVNNLLDLLDQDPSMNEPETHELFDLLADADMQGVLMAHDDIAKKSFVPVKYTKKAEVYQPPVVPSHQEPNMHAHTDDRSKLVIVNKSSTEPLVGIPPFSFLMHILRLLFDTLTLPCQIFKLPVLLQKDVMIRGYASKVLVFIGVHNEYQSNYEHRKLRLSMGLISDRMQRKIT